MNNLIISLIVGHLLASTCFATPILNSVIKEGSKVSEDLELPRWNKELMDKAGLSETSPLPAKVIYQKFGLEQKSAGKFLKAAVAPGQAELHNVLVLHQIPAELRMKLYQKESCGIRAYQYFLVKSGDQNENVGVYFQCNGSCSAVVERRDQKKLSLSKLISLDKAFCEALWNNSVEYKDVHGA